MQDLATQTEWNVARTYQVVVDRWFGVVVARLYTGNQLSDRRVFGHFNRPRTLVLQHYNAVIDPRRLRPRCCHRGSYFKHPTSSPVRPLACNWYYCEQFIAKPKPACALRFSWAATSGNLGLWANMTSSVKSEVRNVSLRRLRRTEPRP